MLLSTVGATTDLELDVVATNVLWLREEGTRRGDRGSCRGSRQLLETGYGTSRGYPGQGRRSGYCFREFLTPEQLRLKSTSSPPFHLSADWRKQIWLMPLVQASVGFPGPLPTHKIRLKYQLQVPFAKAQQFSLRSMYVDGIPWISIPHVP